MTVSQILTSITEAATGIFGIVTSAFNWVVGNPLMIIYLAVGFIGIGFALFGRAKHTAHN